MTGPLLGFGDLGVELDVQILPLQNSLCVGVWGGAVTKATWCDKAL